jgi:serine/threonine-protein kinase
MGEVYEARDPRLQRRVALKVLRRTAAEGSPASTSGSGSGSGRGARLLREARLAAALEHPNVVAIYDVGEIAEPESLKGTTYLAMELIAGSSLRAFLGDANVPVKQRVRWLTDVARALAAAHSRGMVHRDIKPENVMIREDGVVKVLDFGIAKRTSAIVEVGSTGGPQQPTVTGQGMTVGTPCYMAPEQMRGEPLDGRADQFAWGVTAYELLSGELPWVTGGDDLQLVAQVLSRDPPLLSIKNDQVPTAVAAAVMRALAKSRELRFPTMDDLLAVLEGPDAASSAPRPFPSKPSSRSGLATAATERVDAPSRPTTGGLSATHDPERELGPALPRPRARRRWLGLGLVLMTVLAGVGLAAGLRRAPPVVAAASASAAQATAVSTAPVPTAITDLPPPESPSPDAIAAYQSALRAKRDASSIEYAADLRKAVALDPSMAMAHARLAFFAYDWAQEVEARAELAKARGLRGRLGERDAALLDMTELLVARVPPDTAGALGVMEEATRRWPGDAELWLMRGYAAYFVDRVDDALEATQRSLDLDAKYAGAARMRAGFLADVGRLEDARAAVAACLRIVPAATTCLRYRALLAAWGNDCESVLADSETLLAIDPENVQGHVLRANALARRGADAVAVRESLAATWERAGPQKGLVRSRDTSALARFRGDFSAAEASTREWMRAAAKAQLDEAAGAAWALAETLSEEGRSQEAGSVAAEFVRTFELRPRAQLGGCRDETARLGAFARRSGSMPALEADGARDRWLSSMLKGSHRADRDWVTFMAFVVPAESPDDAPAALARLPDLQRLSLSMCVPRFEPDQVIGRVLALAGRDAEAIPMLRRGAEACLPLSNPVDFVRTRLALGDALARTGDTAGACAAYQAVVQQWGSAKPRSVTAEAARRARARLACP